MENLNYLQSTPEEVGQGLKDFYDTHFKEKDHKEIQGMNITTKIMFNRNYNRDERIEFINLIEDEFSEVISKHKELVGMGGRGEWIYKEEDDEH